VCPENASEWIHLSDDRFHLSEVLVQRRMHLRVPANRTSDPAPAPRRKPMRITDLRTLIVGNP
jgi:hypothetical protein